MIQTAKFRTTLGPPNSAGQVGFRPDFAAQTLSTTYAKKRTDTVSQSVSQSLPHSYQRSTWSTNTRPVLDECSMSALRNLRAKNKSCGLYMKSVLNPSLPPRMRGHLCDAKGPEKTMCSTLAVLRGSSGADFRTYAEAKPSLETYRCRKYRNKLCALYMKSAFTIFGDTFAGYPPHSQPPS